MAGGELFSRIQERADTAFTERGQFCGFHYLKKKSFGKSWLNINESWYSELHDFYEFKLFKEDSEVLAVRANHHGLKKVDYFLENIFRK